MTNILAWNYPRNLQYHILCRGIIQVIHNIYYVRGIICEIHNIIYYVGEIIQEIRNIHYAGGIIQGIYTNN